MRLPAPGRSGAPWFALLMRDSLVEPLVWGISCVGFRNTEPAPGVFGKGQALCECQARESKENGKLP